MAGINKPPKAPKGHGPGKRNGNKWFETLDACRREDRERAALLERTIRLHPDRVDVKRAANLAARLRHGADTGDPAPTPASRVFFRGPRLSFIGHASKLAEAVGFGKIWTIDLLPKGFSMTPDELMQFEPEQITNPTRMDLIRCGASRAKGGFFLHVHGRYNRLTDLFDVHMHGFGVGKEMRAVAEGLRDVRKYAEPTVPLDSGKHRPAPRVRISRKPLTDVPYRLSYALQGSWPDRPAGIDDGVKVMSSKKRPRIPEPVHSMWLLWMDRWSLSDLTLMVGLRITNAGFEISNR